MPATQKKLKTRPFDPAKYLGTPEAIAAYLDDAFESGDARIIADALGVVARSAGMAKIAKSAGVGRESLYKTLSEDGNPELSTVLKVLSALGFRLSVETAAKVA